MRNDVRVEAENVEAHSIKVISVGGLSHEVETVMP